MAGHGEEVYSALTCGYLAMNFEVKTVVCNCQIISISNYPKIISDLFKICCE